MHVHMGVMTLAVNTFGYAGTGRDVDVVEGQTVTDVIVELETGVRLTDTNSAPLSGVSIMITRPSYGA
jgi:hypothetical protein